MSCAMWQGRAESLLVTQFPGQGPKTLTLWYRVLGVGGEQKRMQWRKPNALRKAWGAGGEARA